VTSQLANSCASDDPMFFRIRRCAGRGGDAGGLDRLSRAVIFGACDLVAHPIGTTIYEAQVRACVTESRGSLDLCLISPADASRYF